MREQRGASSWRSRPCLACETLRLPLPGILTPAGAGYVKGSKSERYPSFISSLHHFRYANMCTSIRCLHLLLTVTKLRIYRETMVLAIGGGTTDVIKVSHQQLEISKLIALELALQPILPRPPIMIMVDPDLITLCFVSLASAVLQYLVSASDGKGLSGPAAGPVWSKA